ncbi:MAG: hypothetical protein JRJ83_04000 [Deltaproteobacteria bacterium]|nr:hypothetical protein [Deltaproteobacteria bacterium]RLB34421.1 MAG: hypothetical protein DRH20_12125 [Deltaproteobacteria bacterium]
MNNNPLGFAITMAAFAFFIVCPRMGAMTNLLERHTSYPIYWLVIIGTLASIPLLLTMSWLIRKWGLTAGLGFAVLTDLAAAAVLTSVNLKVAVETVIIAIFVIGGNKLAMWITGRFMA